MVVVLASAHPQSKGLREMSKPKVRDGKCITVFGHRKAQQCAAKSKRSGNRCRRAASVGKAVCAIHGGKSTGPKTEAGRQAQVDSVTNHGRETRAIRCKRRAALAELRKLEDAMRQRGIIK